MSEEINNVLTELRDALPKVERVSVQGKGYEVKPFKFIQFADALQIVSPILNYLGATGMSESTIIPAICSNANVFVKLAALALNEDEKNLQEMSAVEGLKVVKAVVKLNMDFFKEEIPALLKEMFPESPSEKTNETNPTLSLVT